MYNNVESNPINQSGDATNRVYQMRPSTKRGCIENMRNGRVLRRNTFKLPGFGSHASIFAIAGRPAPPDGDRFVREWPQLFAIFSRIVIERTMDNKGRFLDTIYCRYFRIRARCGIMYSCFAREICFDNIVA